MTRSEGVFVRVCSAHLVGGFGSALLGVVSVYQVWVVLALDFVRASVAAFFSLGLLALDFVVGCVAASSRSLVSFFCFFFIDMSFLSPHRAATI